MIDKETMFKLLRAAREGNPSEIFPIMLDHFGETAAALSVSETLPQDEHTYSFLLETLGEASEVERVLSQIWDEERIAKSRSGSPEFFFFISLTPYLPGEEKAHLYKMGATVRLTHKGPDIWFHHIVTNSRHREPSTCINWDKLDGEETAMWSILVSKIMSLQEYWYVQAAKRANDSLLVPYDLSDFD